MKKLILALSIICITASSVKAQNILNKIPSTASLAIKYSGSNFSKNISLQKVDSYSFIRNSFLKMLYMDSLTSIQNIGINFEEDACQYANTQDSCMSFVTILPLKNVSQFLQLIQKVNKADVKIDKKNGFNFWLCYKMYDGLKFL